MTKIIDLRPNRSLQNSNFEKYQFSSENFSKNFERKLKTEVLRIEPNAFQESFLEARLFAFHNHLFKNPYNSTCYFIDTSGGIWEFTKDGNIDLIYTSKTISLGTLKKIYNSSISFASEDVTVICDGSGNLEILIKDGDLTQNFLFSDIEPAILADARYIKDNSKIIIALHKIEEAQGKKFSRLIFLHYVHKKNIHNQSTVFELIRKQTLKVKGVIDHVYIEVNGKFFYIVSQDHVKFDYDSLNSVDNEKKNDKNDSLIRIPKYCWSQDEDSVTIYVKIPDKNSKSNAKIETTSNSISVEIEDEMLLNGITSKRLESKLTTWNFKDGTIEIELYKSENGLMWNELILGDTGGEYLPNQALAAEIHERLSHLCSSEQESNNHGQPAIGFNSEQLEECDLSENENIFQRVDLDSHNITHLSMLGSSNRVLFAEKTSSGQIICLRHDHDGCIWKLKETNEDWDYQHISTFPGFGYVEASKTNKKFCLSPTDRSFITIVEHARHAFLYEKPDLGTKIGKQRILDFGDQVSSILGATILDKYLIILTKNVLYQFQVYS